MNEQIQALSYQCWYTDADTGKEEFNRVKFAELIIKECAELAGCNAHVSGFSLGDLIKEHFGIER